jgi:hypothetical protein
LVSFHQVLNKFLQPPVPKKKEIHSFVADRRSNQLFRPSPSFGRWYGASPPPPLPLTDNAASAGFGKRTTTAILPSYGMRVDEHDLTCACTRASNMCSI